jgi:hypothetical protein
VRNLNIAHHVSTLATNSTPIQFGTGQYISTAARRPKSAVHPREQIRDAQSQNDGN